MRTAAILCVDDEPANLAALRLAIGDEFVVLTASSGTQALEVLARQEVSVLLADQRMPLMSGWELCAQARERFPHVVRMIVTAYSDIQAAVAAINNGQVSTYIIKPWREEELLAALRTGVRDHQRGRRTRELQPLLRDGEHLAGAQLALQTVLHTLSNPVASMMVNLQFLHEALANRQGELDAAEEVLAGTLTDCRGAARDALAACERLMGHINGFRRNLETTSRRGGGSDLGATALAVVAMWRRELPRHARVVVEVRDEPWVALDPVLLSQILVNLLTQAQEAVEEPREGGQVVSLKVWLEGVKAMLAISDTGKGFPAAWVSRLFEPFPDGGDLAARDLRLPIVKTLVEGAGGSIRVESEVGKGTTFTLAFETQERTGTQHGTEDFDRGG